MKSYFAYTRVSTTKQGSGVSLQEQMAAIEAYASRNGLIISGWYTEMETAAKQGRREFARMLADLRRKAAQGVIIHKIDRSARNLKDWALIGDLIDVGIDVHFAHESLDLNSRGGRLAADIQAVVAADFIRNLRDETRKGFYGRLKQGLYPLAAPRGYLDQGRGKAKIIDPVEGPLIQEAFELYATGRFGLVTLIAEMHRRGLRTSRGKPLSRHGMAAILHNPFYIGLLLIRSTGEVFEGVHEPLVSPKVYEHVQAVMAGRVFARPTRHEFALRRLVRCGACQRTLTGELQKGRIYYRCHGASCRGTSLSEASLDRLLREELSLLKLDDGDARDFREILKEQIEIEQSKKGERLERLRRDLAATDERLTRLTDALLDCSIDKEMFDERKRTLLEERQLLRAAIATGKADPYWQRIREKFERGFTALDSYISASPARKSEIVKEVSSNFAAIGKEPVITMSFPYSEIRNWNEKRRCDPCRPHVRTARRKAVPIEALISCLCSAATAEVSAPRATD